MVRWVFAVLALNGAVAAAPPVERPHQTAADDRNKVICKTWALTGSLIANHKECRTKDDWNRMRIDTSHITQGGSCNSAETGTCY